MTDAPKLRVLPGSPFPDQVVKVLSDELEIAKQGTYKSVVILSDDGSNLHLAYSGCNDLVQLLGMVTRVAHTIQRRLDDSRMP